MNPLTRHCLPVALASELHFLPVLSSALVVLFLDDRPNSNMSSSSSQGRSGKTSRLVEWYRSKKRQSSTESGSSKKKPRYVECCRGDRVMLAAYVGCTCKLGWPYTDVGVKALVLIYDRLRCLLYLCLECLGHPLDW